MQKMIQIYPCLLKLSGKQESVMDRQMDGWTDGRYYYIPSPLSQGDNNEKFCLNKYFFFSKFGFRASR